MSEPQISNIPNTKNKVKKFLVMFLVPTICLVTVVLYSFKHCTDLGKVASKDYYDPAKNGGGFIAKSNRLLELLLEQRNLSVTEVNNIDDLNRKYPGFEFRLPYDEFYIDGGRASDIRLVDLDPEAINDEELRLFYYNSNLPSLLEKQRRNMGERVFKISFSNDKSGLLIKGIELVPSMFKVALVKDPWCGAIYANENKLLEPDEFMFAVWHHNLIPLRLSNDSTNERNFIVSVGPDKETLLHNTKPVNIFDYYEAYKNGASGVSISFNGGGILHLNCKDSCHVFVKPEDGLDVREYYTESLTKEINKASQLGKMFEMDNDLKLRLNKGNSISSLTIYRNNPFTNLSSIVMTNAGNKRLYIDEKLSDDFTQQILRGLTNTLRNTFYDRDIFLSIDPILSIYLQRELQSYYENHFKEKYKNDNFELSLTVMDMATGNLLAVPYYRNFDEKIGEDIALGLKNPALTRRFIGSTFKPMLSLACVLAEPQLLNYNSAQTHDYSINDKNECKLFGENTSGWSTDGSNEREFWSGCDFTNFISRSDDVYPVALFTMALNKGSKNLRNSKVFNPTAKNIYIRKKEEDSFSWTQIPVIKNLDVLYDVNSYNDVIAHDSLKMAYYLWQNVWPEGVQGADTLFLLDNICPDQTTMYYNSFSAPPLTLRANIVPWVLGQGSNEWNCVKLAEAWTRMLTQRDIHASFIIGDSVRPASSLVTNFSGNSVRPTWNRFLEKLNDAQSSGSLLSPMYKYVNELNNLVGLNNGQQLKLFSKTGTPDNYSRKEYRKIKDNHQWLDVGLYCMGLMTENSFESVKAGNRANGIMCVMRITRITDEKPAKNGVSSSDARDFFSSDFERFKRFYYLTKSYY